MTDSKQKHEDRSDDQGGSAKPDDTDTIILNNALPKRKAFVQYDLVTLVGLALAAALIFLGTLATNIEAPNFTPSLIWAGGVIALVTLLIRSPFWLTFRYDIPALNNPPVQDPVTPVPGHGIVHRGRTEVPLPGDRTRPYIWIWIEPDAQSDCLKGGGKYCWYQYVNLEFFIDGRKKKLKKPIKGATGLYYHFGQWNPDYHVEDVKKSDPKFTPIPVRGKGLLKSKRGRPFKKYGISGTSKLVQGSVMGMGLRGPGFEGILDSPDFCNRGLEKLSPIERLLRRKIKSEDKVKQQVNIPAPFHDLRVKVSIDARSYLVCIKDGKANCIGYIPWAYSIESLIKFSWVKTKKNTKKDTKKNKTLTLGMSNNIPVWKLSPTLGPCRYALTINNWVNGC